jgi:hypothetical protein
MTRTRLGWWACVAAMVLLGPAAARAAARPAPAKTGQIQIAYVEPKSPEHRQLFEDAKAARVLEKMQALLSPIRLPRPLLLKFEGCDGVSNAWYDEGAVTVCYEYLADIWKNAVKEPKPPGITRRTALTGPICDVFFHEVGHALFDLLQIPLFGREEDAADAVSAYVMLQFGKDEARELIAGAAYSYAAEMKLTSAKELRTVEVKYKLEKFADEHSTPAQRVFTLMCVAYGADPKTFAPFVENGWLPSARAEYCDLDYQQVAFAFRTLITPHVDQDLARKVREQAWLPVSGAKPAYRPPKAK